MKSVVSAASAIFALSALATAQAESKILGNFEPYAGGSYQAYAGMWSLYQDDTMGLGRKAVENVDFVSSIEVNGASFPRESVIKWSVPEVPSPVTGVYGYLQLTYGSVFGGFVPKAVQPAQLRDIETLDLFVQFDRSGAGSYNILNEAFLLDDPRDPSSTVLEVGVLMHVSASGRSYFQLAEQLGIYTDAQGRTWDVAVDPTAPHGPFVMFVPTQPWGDGGTVDWAGLFDFVADQGLASGNEWFTGISLGVEPVSGGGQLAFSQFDIDYAISANRHLSSLR